MFEEFVQVGRGIFNHGVLFEAIEYFEWRGIRGGTGADGFTPGRERRGAGDRVNGRDESGTGRVGMRPIGNGEPNDRGP